MSTRDEAPNDSDDQATKRRRLILLGLVVVVLLCLVGALAYNIFFRGSDDIVTGPTPTPTFTATDEGPVVIITPEELTPTPTRVIVEAATEEPTETPEPTVEPTNTRAPAPPTPNGSTGAEFTLAPSDTLPALAIPKIDDVLVNGGFDDGFEETGVGSNWQSFSTDGAIFSFTGESHEPLIHAGNSAQRISVDQATEPDRFAGIYQTVEVVPSEAYTLTMHGQIRTGYGDVNDSSYGYRVQYAVDPEGGTNWRAIPEEDWVELPWDEEMLYAEDPTFSEFTSEITPTSDEVTLFVRVWNKWANPTLSEYTIDSLSLEGPVPGSAATIVRVETEDVMIERPLPVTGIGDSANFLADGRFWGAIVVLTLLAVGAIYRAKWSW
jgi:hypothetical protein